jgi:macrolide-specific efflux system membrane fusion protein
MTRLNRNPHSTFAFIAATLLALLIPCCDRTRQEASSVVLPVRDTVTKYISTTGTVKPKNRLEINPTLAGRVESVLVVEGQHVSRGQTMAWMSSTERASLIDAARTQGDREMKYWESVYKPTPVVAPISGTVIVRSIEPGQTVTTSTVMLVLADRLVVKANVDETDIGSVKLGMGAELSLDSYPDVKVRGKVSHIAYESTVTNNVTMYVVDIVPDTIPQVFRSGMSATINIIESEKQNALLVPMSAVTMEGNSNYVLVEAGKGAQPRRQSVTLGIVDNSRVEILSGLNGGERLIVTDKAISQSAASEKKNPFMPFPPGRKKSGSKQ